MKWRILGSLVAGVLAMNTACVTKNQEGPNAEAKLTRLAKKNGNMGNTTVEYYVHGGFGTDNKLTIKGSGEVTYQSTDEIAGKKVASDIGAYSMRISESDVRALFLTFLRSKVWEAPEEVRILPDEIVHSVRIRSDEWDFVRESVVWDEDSPFEQARSALQEILNLVLEHKEKALSIQLKCLDKVKVGDAIELTISLSNVGTKDLTLLNPCNKTNAGRAVLFVDLLLSKTETKRIVIETRDMRGPKEAVLFLKPGTSIRIAVPGAVRFKKAGEFKLGVWMCFRPRDERKSLYGDLQSRSCVVRVEDPGQ